MTIPVAVAVAVALAIDLAVACIFASTSTSSSSLPLPLFLSSHRLALWRLSLVMHLPSLIWTSLVTALAVVASPLHLHRDYVVKETNNVPPRWSNIGQPHPLHPLTLHIGLRPGNFALLEEHLHEGDMPSHSPSARLTSDSLGPIPPSIWPASLPTRGP